MNTVFIGNSSETRTIFQTFTMLFPMSGYFLLLLIFLTFSPAVSKTTTNNSKGTPAPTASVCHNVVNYNSFSAGPSKEIKNLLQEMKMQLTDLQKKVGAIAGNNSGKGENRLAESGVFLVLFNRKSAKALLSYLKNP